MDSLMNGLVGKWKVRCVDGWVCKWLDLMDRWMKLWVGIWI